MNRLLYLFFLLFYQFCCAQNAADPFLLESERILSPIDSIGHPALVGRSNSGKVWRPHFTYVDSINIDHITYLSDGLRIKGYLVQPKKKGNYPCVIFNRGGVKEFGALGLVQAIGLLGEIARHGYVVIASQYRGNGGSEGREEYGGADLNDVLRLIPLLSEIPAADTSRIGMFGGSRGGMMTYMALTRTKRIKTAAVLAAPADKFASIKDRPGLEDSLYELVAGYEQNKEAELNRRSAIKWAHKFSRNVPLLILHGNSDWRVKSSQSIRLALELDKHRIPYRLMIFEGADHGLSEFRTEFYQVLVDWFDRYLKNGAALPNMDYHGR